MTKSKLKFAIKMNTVISTYKDQIKSYQAAGFLISGGMDSLTLVTLLASVTILQL